MARSPKTPKPASTSTKPSRKERGAARSERFKQIKTAFTMTRERDPRLVPLLGVAILAPLAIFITLAVVLGNYFLFPLLKEKNQQFLCIGQCETGNPRSVNKSVKFCN